MCEPYVAANLFAEPACSAGELSPAAVRFKTTLPLAAAKVRRINSVRAGRALLHRAPTVLVRTAFPLHSTAGDVLRSVFIAPDRNAPGGKPVSLRKCRVKALWSQNPVLSAISARV